MDEATQPMSEEAHVQHYKRLALQRMLANGMCTIDKSNKFCSGITVPVTLMHRYDTMERTDIESIPNSNVFLVDNILSRDECRELVEETEAAGYQPLHKEFPVEYRNNERYWIPTPTRTHTH